MIRTGSPAARRTVDHPAVEVRAHLLHLQRVVRRVGGEVQAAAEAQERHEAGRPRPGGPGGGGAGAASATGRGTRCGSRRARPAARRGRKSSTSPSTTRTFGRPASSTAASPVVCTSTPIDALVRASTAQFDQRLAGAEADVEHERPVAAERTGSDSSGPSTAKPKRSMAAANVAARSRRQPAPPRLERPRRQRMNPAITLIVTPMIVVPNRYEIRAWRVIVRRMSRLWMFVSLTW